MLIIAGRFAFLDRFCYIVIYKKIKPIPRHNQEKNMKRTNLYVLFGLVFSLFFPAGVFSQNQPPVVDQVTACVDTANHIITVTFNVSDQEQDTLDIFVSLSNDGGETFLCPVDSASGDIGWPAIPGEGKQVSWRYDPEELYIDSSVLKWYKVKVIADDRYRVDLQDLADQVDSLNLKNNLEAIIGVRNYAINLDHMLYVRELITERLSAGNSKLILQDFRYGTYDALNIIGMLPGQSREANLYILDGHFDTVAISPGADDNGAAVAGLLEAARILTPFHYRNSLQLIAFDLEEYNLGGSTYYVNHLANNGYDLKGVVNFEMIGYYSSQPNSQILPAGFELLFPDAYNAIAAQQFRGNFLANVGNAQSSDLIALFDSCAAAFVPQLLVHSIAVPGTGTMVPDLRRSDHAIFWDKGYNALMLTDGGNLRNPNYHTAGDSIGTLNFTFMTNIVKAAITTVARLAGIMHCGYTVADLQIAAPSAIPAKEGVKPADFQLEQNYPNPFNPQTRINYYVPEAGNVDIKIFATNGQEVQTLVHKYHKAGTYSVNFNAASLPCGLYLYTLEEGNKILACKKMLLLK